MPVLPPVDGLFVGVQTFRQRLLGHPQTRLSEQREGVDRISHKAGRLGIYVDILSGQCPAVNHGEQSLPRRMLRGDFALEGPECRRPGEGPPIST